jgi:hypothetical protein
MNRLKLNSRRLAVNGKRLATVCYLVSGYRQRFTQCLHNPTVHLKHHIKTDPAFFCDPSWERSRVSNLTGLVLFCAQRAMRAREEMTLIEYIVAVSIYGVSRSALAFALTSGDTRTASSSGFNCTGLNPIRRAMRDATGATSKTGGCHAL